MTDVFTFDSLRLYADEFSSTQQHRLSVANRIGSLPGEPPETLRQHVELLQQAEHELALAMRRCFRRVAPEVHRWTTDTVGLGEHLMARLLGTIGDPVHAQPYAWFDDKPDAHTCGPTCGRGRHLVALVPFDRTPRQLLAFAGHGDPADRRRAGMHQDDALRLGNPRAKFLTHLLAESCMKKPGTHLLAVPNPETTAAEKSASEDLTTDGGSAVATRAVPGSVRRRSPYRDTYDQARAKYAERDWTDGHRHNAALRYVGREILIDLWRVQSGLPPRWKPEDGL